MKYDTSKFLVLFFFGGEDTPSHGVMIALFGQYFRLVCAIICPPMDHYECRFHIGSFSYGREERPEEKGVGGCRRAWQRPLRRKPLCGDLCLKIAQPVGYQRQNWRLLYLL
jgi:hypothetical protein